LTRTCMHCGGEYTEGTEGTRRRCFPCIGRASLRINYEWKRAREGPLKGGRRPTHSGSITCRRCGAEEARTWVTRRPSLCIPCRGRSVSERCNEFARRYSMRKNSVKTEKQ